MAANSPAYSPELEGVDENDTSESTSTAYSSGPKFSFFQRRSKAQTLAIQRAREMCKTIRDALNKFNLQFLRSDTLDSLFNAKGEEMMAANEEFLKFILSCVVKLIATTKTCTKIKTEYFHSAYTFVPGGSKHIHLFDFDNDEDITAILKEAFYIIYALCCNIMYISKRTISVKTTNEEDTKRALIRMCNFYMQEEKDITTQSWKWLQSDEFVSAIFPVDIPNVSRRGPMNKF